MFQNIFAFPLGRVVLVLTLLVLMLFSCLTPPGTLPMIFRLSIGSCCVRLLPAFFFFFCSIAHFDAIKVMLILLVCLCRAYRIGQWRDVTVLRLISLGTVEEVIYLRQVYKQVPIVMWSLKYFFYHYQLIQKLKCSIYFVGGSLMFYFFHHIT